MNAPNVFISYSPTKCRDQRVTRRLIDTVTRAAAARNWRIIDPMVEPGVGSIGEKVEAALRASDALFVDGTTSVPNVMFETGFARSRGCPVLVLIDTTAHDDSSLKGYFDFVGLQRTHPLPNDLGDVEYLEYPGDSGDEAAWTTFQDRLACVLDQMAQSLTEEILLFRRSCQQILAGATKFMKSHPPDHPILSFLGGWHAALAQGFDHLGDTVFQVSAAHYRQCLSGFQGARRRHVRAIADLTDPVERFWADRPDPLETAVSERIFLLDWRWFYDTNSLGDIVDMLDRHSREYAVRVAHSARLDPHPLEFGVGRNLLLMTPDLVGGYIDKKGAPYLRAERSIQRHKHAEAAYKRIRSQSIEFRTSWTAEELRTAWMEHHGIGKWDPDWTNAQRSARYYDCYDQHIRCWIPEYDKVISHCANLCKVELMSCSRRSTAPVRVLEIGAGTGALTGELLGWIENWNAPALNLTGPVVSTYLAIDQSEPMVNAAKAKLTARTLKLSLRVASAPDRLPAEARKRRFDLICGSLVLHDLIHDVDGGAPAVLTRLREMLTPGGCIVFADAFLLRDDDKRRKQLQAWREWMGRSGLSPDDVETFWRGNDDLLGNPSSAAFANLARECGYERAEIAEVPGALVWSPLAVCVAWAPA